MTMSPTERTAPEVKPIGRMDERTNEGSAGMESNDLGKTS